jgi:ATP-binding protein involved in chromosome partitioning
VSSAKGSIGKSTVCVNLAVLAGGARRPHGRRRVQTDIHLLVGTSDRTTRSHKEISPVEKDGLKLMSLGFLTEKGQPVIWRGPIVMGVVKKFLQDVEWGDLDYLMIDMPPGTGDAQLTLVQTVPLTGAIIVTTPSAIAGRRGEGARDVSHRHAPVLGSSRT